MPMKMIPMFRYLLSTALVTAAVPALADDANTSAGSGSATVTSAPEAELKALDDTLTAFLPNASRQQGPSADTSSPRAEERETVTAAPEAELKALDDTLDAF